MNEKLQYAEMLDMPVSTCSITYKPQKKRKKPAKPVDADSVKQELIEKVNEVPEVSEKPETENTVAKPKLNTTTIRKVSKKSKIIEKLAEVKVSVIGVELIAIGVLVATIFLTNALVPNSGINVFMRNVFGSNKVETVVDEREYKDFTAILPTSELNAITENNGIMNLSLNGSVYSPCDGKVSKIDFDEKTKTYTMEITHNDNFKTVLSGIDYAYSEMGGSVFSNIPVGHVSENATVCFYNGSGDMITDYTIADGAVVWAV